jgi:UDP-glucose 4-epimerase
MPVAINDSNFTHILGSILDKTFLRDALRDCDSVIHLAAHLGVKRTEKNRLRCLDINVDGTRNVLEAAQGARTVRKFIFASSSEVYGEPISNPVTEQSITQGKTVYAISKLAGEELTKAFGEELKAFDTCILRFFNTYGIGQVGQFVITRFVNNVLSGKSPIINGAGDQLRSYCFAEDTARAVVLALQNPSSSGKIYNIGSSVEPITILDLAKKIISLSPSNSSLKPSVLGNSFGDRDKSREIFFRHADTSLARQELSFQANISLDEGLKKLIDAGIGKKDWGTHEKNYEY